MDGFAIEKERVGAMGERVPDPQVVEAQRREFFAQLHRWLRQEHRLLVLCNNEAMLKAKGAKGEYDKALEHHQKSLGGNRPYCPHPSRCPETL